MHRFGVPAEREDVFAVRAAFADEFLGRHRVSFGLRRGMYVWGRYAVELDYGADHACSEGSLLAWRDIEGHV